MTDTANHSLRLVDADTHVNEPPDLWTSRVPAKFRDRVPRMEHFEQGDAWVGEGVSEPINFGFNASATLPREARKPWVRFDEIPAGGYDPKVRLAEMDQDLVDAAVFYPTPRLSQILIANKDAELHLAMVQAYNDWLIDYTSANPDRLGAIIIVPNRGIEMAVKEIQRCAANATVVGALIGCFPHGDTDLAEEDDAVWEAILEAGLLPHIHVGVLNDFPIDLYAPGRITAGRSQGEVRFCNAAPVVVQFLNSDVFKRLPELRIVMAEVDAGWVPYLKEQMDNRFRRRTFGTDARHLLLPSEYIREHFYFTFITDQYAIRNRHDIGTDRLMWSSDFPHSGADWPNSWRSIAAGLDDVPADEREQILALNAQSIYHFKG